MLKGFREFMSRGNVIDLAVAVVIGAAFTQVVDALVKGIILPIVSAMFGKPSFDDLTFTINGSKFLYGTFLTAVVNFVLVAAAIYFLVVTPIRRLGSLQARRREAGRKEDEASVPSDEVVTLREIRDLLAGPQRGVTGSVVVRRPFVAVPLVVAGRS